MEQLVKESLWNQFGASLDMLENAIRKCPPQVWNGPGKFWYNAYHCLFFLDYYLTMRPRDFFPPENFSFSEFNGEMPNRVYDRSELTDYVYYNRDKLRALITGLTSEQLSERWINASGRMNYSVLEILLYNMRHVQHHAAQLNLLLRQQLDDAPEWVSRTEEDL